MSVSKPPSAGRTIRSFLILQSHLWYSSQIWLHIGILWEALETDALAPATHSDAIVLMIGLNIRIFKRATVEYNRQQKLSINNLEELGDYLSSVSQFFFSSSGIRV